jgi:serine/threonine-protein kinase PpkA
VMHITQPVPLLPPRFERFQDFIDIALAKNPDDRFQSGFEFIEALAQIDLDDYETFETGVELISPEDLDTLPGHSNFNSGFNSDINSGLYSDVAAVAEGLGRFYEQKKRALFLPITISVFFMLLLGGIGMHVYYVNVLGKQINFSGMPAATLLTNTSKSFGVFTGSLFGSLLPETYDISALSPEAQSLVKSMNTAIRDDRLFFPPFDCAELYFLELVKLNPGSDLVNIKAKELLNVAMDNTLKLLSENEVQKANQLITESKRMLPYVDDKALHIKHQQISSSVIIAL